MLGAYSVAVTCALVEDAPAKGSEFSSGGEGARNSHHAPIHTTSTEPAVANARAGPYQSIAAARRERRRSRNAGETAMTPCVRNRPEDGSAAD